MNEVLEFWFKQLTPEDWFKKSDELDQIIRDRFLETHEAVTKGETYTWRKTAEGRLAEILVLDQFSRNIFRNNPRSFASDPQALTLAQACIEAGDDQKLTPTKRAFVYMPYMHSESLLIHDIAMKLFAQEGMERNLDFERAHRNIIAQFGRYPHRNEILGRESSPEEIEFLKGPNSSF